LKNIKLACNWSRSLRELLDEGIVRIDYIKTGVYGSFYEDIDTMISLHPVLVHGFGYRGHTGMKNLHEVDFDKANELLRKCDSPHYGLHFGIENKNVGNMTAADIYKFMSEQTQIFTQRLNVPLLLENTPDSDEERSKFDLYPLAEAELITDFIRDNNVFFLLDIAHAKVAASYRSWEVEQYFSSLPLERTKEIHINGSGFDENGVIADVHSFMREDDYKLLEWVLTRTNPDIITLEYSGKRGESGEAVKENLIVQLDRLNAIIKSA
jgi:uncharacterized protein (UPF0276 family)